MPDDNQVNITIDGKPATVPKGTLLVEAANTIGVEIPVFCYHEKLGPFGCCRMCLVEVEKMPKLATACTQTVMPDMVVKTNTDKVKKAREGVLEFTLLNHPLDCPVCDKGGECRCRIILLNTVQAERAWSSNVPITPRRHRSARSSLSTGNVASPVSGAHGTAISLSRRAHW